METVNLLETLLRAHGPSGDEGDICQVIRREAEQYADEVAVDTMGNLIAHKKGAGPRVMLAAHMDRCLLYTSNQWALGSSPRWSTMARWSSGYDSGLSRR